LSQRPPSTDYDSMDQPDTETPARQSDSQMDHTSDDDEVVLLSTTLQPKHPSSSPKDQGVNVAAAFPPYYSYPSAPVYPTSSAAVYSDHSYYYNSPLSYAAASPFPYAVTYWYPIAPIVTPYYSAGTPVLPAYSTPLSASAAAAPSIPTSCDDDTCHAPGTAQMPDKEDGAATSPLLMPKQELAPAVNKRAWLERDDRKLRALVRRLGADRMEEVASKLSGWTVEDCRSRWNLLVRPRKPWTDDEDQRLRELVPKYSSVDHNDEVAIDWMLVSKVIRSRLPTRCQERWEELLAQGIEPVPHPVPSSSEQNVLGKHVKKEKEVHSDELVVANERSRDESFGSRGRLRVPQSQIATIQAIVTGKLRSNSAARKRKERADEGVSVAIHRRRSLRNSKQS
jgi:Myb-like DNA-binding domain